MNISGYQTDANPYAKYYLQHSKIMTPQGQGNNTFSNLSINNTDASSVNKSESIPNSQKVGTTNKTSKVECTTCQNRKYQDGSNDPGVSFKAPAHIDPASSGAAVMAHEQEHVVREQGKAASEGREVVSQSVRIDTSICPECGRVYVSGGETRTTTAAKEQKDASTDLFKQNYKNIMTANMGTIFDTKL